MFYLYPEWFISHVATIHAQGVAAGIYTTNGNNDFINHSHTAPDSCLHILNDCKCQILFVDSQEQLDKINTIRNEAKYLKAIVMWGDQPKVSSIKSPNHN